MSILRIDTFLRELRMEFASLLEDQGDSKDRITKNKVHILLEISIGRALAKYTDEILDRLKKEEELVKANFDK